MESTPDIQTTPVTVSLPAGVTPKAIVARTPSGQDLDCSSEGFLTIRIVCHGETR